MNHNNKKTKQKQQEKKKKHNHDKKNNKTHMNKKKKDILNKKNEIAMETSHTKIMKTLVRLCKPDLDDFEGAVSFENVRGQMIDIYDEMVDIIDFQHFFFCHGCRWPRQSSLMVLHDFTKLYANPEIRKMLRFDAHGVVS